MSETKEPTTELSAPKRAAAPMPIWKSHIGTGYKQMISVYGGDKDEKAKAKATTEFGYAVQIFQKNKSLQGCSPESIINAVSNIARTTLSLHPTLQLAYLIPRKGQCTLEISYRGMVKLLKDSGSIVHIEAFMVFEDEDFDYNTAMGTLMHNQTHAKTEAQHNARKIHGCYTRAVSPTGFVSYEFMPLWELDKVRSTSASKEGAVWKQWRDEMYKKTVMKRHSKTLMGTSPTDALITAMSIDNENNGLQSLQAKSKISQALINASETINVEPIEDTEITKELF
jgi:phage RecT family recombinase|tara:strand:+ start:2762 stop:3610 length:849 start_codon:yes stop_codon:yes gene_type:complete